MAEEQEQKTAEQVAEKLQIWEEMDHTDTDDSSIGWDVVDYGEEEAIVEEEPEEESEEEDEETENDEEKSENDEEESENDEEESESDEAESEE